MSSKISLRIASFIMLLHTVGHTLGHLGWKQNPDATRQSTIDSMLNNTFEFMGATASYGKFFDGYGFAGTLTLLLVTVVLWMISDSETEQTKKIVSIFSIFLFLWAIMEFVYFFAFAAAFTVVAAVLTVWAGARINSEAAKAPRR